MPPALPSRIEHKDAQGNLIAEAYCSADGITIASYDGQGGQLAYAQVDTTGGVTLSGGGGSTARIEADGSIVLDPGSAKISLPNVPTGDPHVWSQVYMEVDGTVKVSAG